MLLNRRVELMKTYTPKSDLYLILGDVHGCYLTMMTMITKHPDRQLILLGDLIDRGPRSREVIEYAITHSISTTYGNHEDLALAYSSHAARGFKSRCSEHYEDDVWLCNGGLKALENWNGPFTEESVLPDDVLKWMSSLPTHIKVPHPSGGRDLLATHTGYGLDADKGQWLSALWGRHTEGDGDFPDDGYFRVFGHCKKRKPIVTDTYAMIDTGCAYEGYGKLTGLKWPEMEIVQVDNIDS